MADALPHDWDVEVGVCRKCALTWEEQTEAAEHISCRPGMSKGTINIEYLRLRRELGSYDERELQAALDYLEEHLHG